MASVNEAMKFLAKPSLALGFGAFFLCAATCAHFDELAAMPASFGLVSLSQGPYTVIVGVLFALALGGLATTLAAKGGPST
jgi:hypothetical protein